MRLELIDTPKIQSRYYLFKLFTSFIAHRGRIDFLTPTVQFSTIIFFTIEFPRSTTFCMPFWAKIICKAFPIFYSAPPCNISRITFDLVFNL